MNKFLIAIALPVITLLAWTVSLEFGAQTGRVVKMRIAGYDPRDLLAGHYIRYTLAMGDSNICEDVDTYNRCVCLVPDADGEHHAPAFKDNCLHPTCALILKGDCIGKQFFAGVERYSIPESLAPALATIPENSSVVLSVDSKGSAQVLKVMVNDESLEEYALKKIEQAKQEAPIP